MSEENARDKKKKAQPKTNRERLKISGAKFEDVVLAMLKTRPVNKAR